MVCKPNGLLIAARKEEIVQLTATQIKQEGMKQYVKEVNGEGQTVDDLTPSIDRQNLGKDNIAQ